MTFYFHEIIFKNIFPRSDIDSIDIVRYKYRYNKRTDIDMFNIFPKKRIIFQILKLIGND